MRHISLLLFNKAGEKQATHAEQKAHAGSSRSGQMVLPTIQNTVIAVDGPEVGFYCQYDREPKITIG